MEFRLMLSNLLFGEAHLEDLGRYATDDAIGRTGTGDNCAGCDHGAAAYGHTLEDGYVRANPHAVFNHYGLVVLRQLLTDSHVDDVFAEDVDAVVSCDDGRARTENDLTANGAWGFGAVDDRAFRDARTIAYAEVMQALDVALRRA